MPRVVLGLLPALLLTLCLCAAVPAAGAPTVLAENGRTVTIGGTVYVQGELFLESHADTLALAERGFRDFTFLGRSVRTVKYRALWPRDVQRSELPPQVTGFTTEPSDNSVALLDLLTPEERGKLLESIETRRRQSPAIDWAIITLPGRYEGVLEISTRRLESELWLRNRRPAVETPDFQRVGKSSVQDARPPMACQFVQSSQRGILATMIYRPYASAGSGYARGGSRASGTSPTRFRQRSSNPARRSGGSYSGYSPSPEPLFISGPVRYSGIEPSHSLGIQGPSRRR